MADNIKHYASETIEVSYDVERCIHAAECVRGLPAVFDPQQRPWIQPERADAAAIAAAVERCPSGALHYRRLDGGPAEVAPQHNTIAVRADGPLYAHGDLRVCATDGSELCVDTRVALCRCGRSAHKPFCDNAHEKSGFKASAEFSGTDVEGDAVQTGQLTITVGKNGPLLLKGPFELRGADAASTAQGSKAALCRCGASSNKPFCDGTHTKIGFKDG